MTVIHLRTDHTLPGVHTACGLYEWQNAWKRYKPSAFTWSSKANEVTCPECKERLTKRQE